MSQKLDRNHYFPRIVDQVIQHKLSYAGAIELRGPKWYGENAIGFAACRKLPDDAGSRQEKDYLLLADTKPSILLKGPAPRLIDEWQEAPQLWDTVRFSVDQSSKPGLFLLTGSSIPTSPPSHSGAGRIASIDMGPMSLTESKDSTVEVPLEALFNGEVDCFGHSECDIEDMAYLICRGGWPRAVTTSNKSAALEMASDYVTTIAEQDISRADGVTRNPQYARLILREYARLTASQATHSTILKDLKARDIDLSRDTVNGYLAALRRLYVIQELSAWTPTLRAKSRITKTPTRHFACPSIAAAALGASPESLLLDTATMGLLFESLCVRDLRVYAQANNDEIFHYHDEAGREADAVVQLRDGRYALFEMKLGTSLVDEGAKSLVRLREKIDTNAIGEPVFCAVITPGGFAIRRDDGVFVIPITCLTA